MVLGMNSPVVPPVFRTATQRDDVFRPKDLVHQCSDAVHVLVADLDEDRA